ncbi:hypothetical protein RYX36_012131 [Vicia faba]
MNPKNQPVYVLRFCGVSDENPGPAGAAAILLGEDRTVVKGFEYAHEPIRRLWVAVLELKHSFHAFHIHLIPRLENSLADAQAKQAANLQESEVQEDDLVA